MASINSQRAPSSLGTFLIGIACLAAFAAVIVVWTKSGGTKFKAPPIDAVEAERGAARLQKRLDLEKEWAGKLQTVAWVNKEKGEVQVPIEDAIKVVAAELKSKKVAKTEVKVPPIPPAPVVDPKSPEPPPLPLPSAPQGADLTSFSDPFAPAPTAAPVTNGTNGTNPPVPATPPAPVPATPPTPAPAIPPPAIPPKEAAPAPPVNSGVAAAPLRPPLINWTESK